MLFSPEKVVLTLFLLLLCGPATGAVGQVDVHVVNLTVVAIGWPNTAAELSRFEETVTSVVCGPLAHTASNKTPISCGGLLAPVSVGKLSVQAYAETVSPGDALLVRRTFWGWAHTYDSAMLETLTSAVSSVAGTPLSLLSKVSGVYTVPCRGKSSLEVLPLCASTSNCLTSILVDDLKESVMGTFCGYVPNPCSAHITTKMVTPNQVMVNITNLPNTLELALLFTDKVRSGVLHASRIELYSDGQLAQLYASDEGMYENNIKVVPQCDVETGLWMLSFIAIIPVLFVLFCYFWCMGRHHAKKVERRAIVEDELRALNMIEPQGAAETAPGAQQLVAYNNEYPQEASASQLQQQQQELYEGYDQFAAEDNFVYPQEFAADPQQEGEEYHDVYDQQAYNGVEGAAIGDEYVEPRLEATFHDDGTHVDENQNHGGHAASSQSGIQGDREGGARRDLAGNGIIM
ncbi:hypothetical protein TraAM80_08397 [Trypanosoma rangeli]|uniref:Golgi/lysosome glycoprotein n=1 Tax=Trypanosoma rangeli TaxID=5698 RepID=A0A3R7KEY1_TRYRA|nr:uncharacterized protein TraAM80_08397 [Trypanosoma rangeli]RNE99109.1 hypothetical protein TraAM80_08397 [Trypanosoma rangeli]|eukprot:RNE99109.1 hypothetical protein TraAM80_08397 [Trypanosoma rangeli]